MRLDNDISRPLEGIGKGPNSFLTRWNTRTLMVGTLFLAGTAIVIYVAQKFFTTKKDSSSDDTLRARATTAEPSGLIRHLTHLIQWVSSFFQDPPIDPVLFERWDPLVEKEYDPIDAPNPRYVKEHNESWRGKTIADDFVRAVSKTGLFPSFKHVLVFESRFLSITFDQDTQYINLQQRAKAGEFRGSDTLFVIAAVKSRSVKQEKIELWREEMIKRRYPVQCAQIIILNSSEVGLLRQHRLPLSLRKILTS